MRGLVLVAALATFVAFGAPRPASASDFSAGTTISASTSYDVSYELQNPVHVDISLNNGGGRWYRSPVWIAIGAIAGVVVLLMLVLAVRGGGGGTTIVKD